ncbi:MAG: ion transporter [Bacteroidota bacterium]|nr:ion transporter [Bacteroidota bacterium]
MKLTQEQKQALHPVNIIVFFLSLYVVAALVIDTFFPLPPEVSSLLRKIDNAVCVIFFIDFLYRLFTAKNKWKYLRWGWIDLVSSLPMHVLSIGRLFRVFQLIRVLRALRSIDLVAHFLFRNKVKGAFTTAAVVAFAMIVICSIGILEFEKDAPRGNIKTPEDALWWSYVTITTVGYGDHYPVTTGGRILAALLMTIGVSLFGTFTAYVASWFVEKNEETRVEHEDAAAPQKTRTKSLTTVLTREEQEEEKRKRETSDVEQG